MWDRAVTVSGEHREAILGVAGLVVLYAFTLAAVLGFAVYGTDPSRLAGQPAWAIDFYSRSFGFFAITHITLASGVLIAMLIARTGVQWLPVFVGIYSISLTSELAGTTWGVPFGGYAYTPLLGPQWFDRVPVLIPLSWFFMALPSYALCALAVRRPWVRVLLASLLLAAWDLALDPAMSHATPYWLWADTGPYYGMPWLNLFGWYVTGAVLMMVLASARAERWTATVSTRWWAAFYGGNLLLALGMCVAAGLWMAVATTGAVLIPLAFLLTVRQRLPQLSNR